MISAPPATVSSTNTYPNNFVVPVYLDWGGVGPGTDDITIVVN